MKPENLSTLLAYSRIRRRTMCRCPSSAAGPPAIDENRPSRRQTSLLKDLLGALLGPQVRLLNYGVMAGAAISLAMCFWPEQPVAPGAACAFVFATALACLRLAIGEQTRAGWADAWAYGGLYMLALALAGLVLHEPDLHWPLALAIGAVSLAIWMRWWRAPAEALAAENS